MAGKAQKQEKNRKKELNDDIEFKIIKYFTEYGEMPSYLMNFGNQAQDQYRQQFGMMINQFSLVAANMKLIEKEVNDSGLSKASKKKILDLINASMGGDGE
jgi:hypothetical protein